ncbi:MAG: TlyA family RNA methyltransferase [Lewinellaceae bacterium]|nr:TlyA family RNA methyltransferase [Lewinella sp.]MCB9279532.1 TlyA family RNA methyltransferase [Lewinellaceae bacterium]
MRLDKWLVDNGRFESREKAQLAIREGNVLLNGSVASKPSFTVGEADQVTVLGPGLRYVSRGGLKLEKAIGAFQLDFSGKVVLDIGASTGGFTDCALQHGARRVFAVDVGRDQLHKSLLNNDKVVNIEGLHLRELTLQLMENTPADFIVIDVSFISLEYVFPFLGPFLQPGGRIVALIKPQFEMKGRRRFKNGIIKDEKVRGEALEMVKGYASASGYTLLNFVPTFEDRQEKNVEYLGLFVAE